MHSIGIDIGRYSIKIAEVVQKGRSYDLVRVDEKPLSLDPNRDTTIEIIEHLKSIPQDKARVVMGLSGNELCWRPVFFPFTQRHKIAKSLPFELDDKVPLSIDTSVIEAFVSRQVLGGCEVLGLMASHESVKKHLNQATDAGLQLYALSAKPLAFSNLFQPWQDEVPLIDGTQIKGDIDVFVELGHRVSNLILLTGGAVLDFRTLTWGGHNIIEQVAKKYSLHYKEACAKLHTEGEILLTPSTDSRDRLALSEVIKHSVSDFSYRLNLILVELKSLYKVQVPKINLYGGASKIKNLAPFLTQTMNININAPKNLPRHPELDLKTQGASITALGLALEGIKKPKNPPINFLKGDFQQSSNTLTHFVTKWKHTMAVATALYVLCFMWAVLRAQVLSENANTLYSNLKQVAVKVTGLPRRQTSARNLKRFIAEARQREKIQLELEKLNTHPSALDVLNKISQNAPSQQQTQLDIQSLSINKGRLRLQARSQSPEGARAFAQSLQSLAKGQVTLPTSQQVNLNFELLK